MARFPSVSSDQPACLNADPRILIQLLSLPSHCPCFLAHHLRQLFPKVLPLVLATEYALHVGVRYWLRKPHILLVLPHNIRRNENVQHIIQPPPQIFHCLYGKNSFGAIFAVLGLKILKPLAGDIKDLIVIVLLFIAQILADYAEEDIREVLDGYLLTAIQQFFDIPSHSPQPMLIRSSPSTPSIFEPCLDKLSLLI